MQKGAIMSDSLATESRIEPVRRARFRVNLRSLFIGVFCCVLVGGLLWAVAIGPAREAGRMSKCACRLTQIGMAMQNYEGQYGTFPPAYCQLGGKPSSSWRLELIPFMELQAEYDRYHRDEPWNSSFNRQLADAVAAQRSMYRCPSAPSGQNRSLANYVMPVGPGAISPGAAGVERAAIVDGTSYTIAVAEIADTDIYWTEPRDLPAAKMSYKVNDSFKPGISSPHRGGAMAVFADGHTQWLSDSTDPDVVKALISIDGNEKVSLPLAR